MLVKIDRQFKNPSVGVRVLIFCESPIQNRESAFFVRNLIEFNALQSKESHQGAFNDWTLFYVPKQVIHPMGNFKHFIGGMHTHKQHKRRIQN